MSDARGVSASFLRFVMDSSVEDPRWVQLMKLAYHPGSNPKRPLPGPLFDLSVVGLFMFLAIGYALT